MYTPTTGIRKKSDLTVALPFSPTPAQLGLNAHYVQRVEEQAGFLIPSPLWLALGQPHCL